MKCTPCHVWVESMSTRFRINSNGTVQIEGQQTVYEADDLIAKKVRKEATRQRKNRLARERHRLNMKSLQQGLILETLEGQRI